MKALGGAFIKDVCNFLPIFDSPTPRRCPNLLTPPPRTCIHENCFSRPILILILTFTLAHDDFMYSVHSFNLFFITIRWSVYNKRSVSASDLNTI